MLQRDPRQSARERVATAIGRGGLTLDEIANVARVAPNFAYAEVNKSVRAGKAAVIDGAIWPARYYAGVGAWPLIVLDGGRAAQRRRRVQLISNGGDAA